MTDSNHNDSTSTNSNSTNDTNVVLVTLRIYGSLYLICLLLYICILQKKFPKAFNVRSWNSNTNSNNIDPSNSSSNNSSCHNNENGDDNDENDDVDEVDEGRKVNQQVQVSTPASTKLNINSNNRIQQPMNIAQTQYTNMFSFIYQVFYLYNDIQLLHHCGMDGVCFLRALRFGRILSIISCCNAIWLIPLYYTVETTNDNNTDDPLSLISVSNLPSYSKRFIGTVLAAYIIYIYAMYLIYLEYKWFTSMKHYFLSQPSSRNYTVYVSGIPRPYRSSQQLANYFRQCCGGGNSSPTNSSAVYEAHIAMETPKLDKLIERRKIIIQKLEHTVALEKKTGQMILHRNISMKNNTMPKKYRNNSSNDNDTTGNSNSKSIRTGAFCKVESVQTFENELQQLNHIIVSAVRDILGRTTIPISNNKNNDSSSNCIVDSSNNDSNSSLKNNGNNNKNNSKHSRRSMMRRYNAKKDLLAAIRADLNNDNDDSNNDDDDNDYDNCNNNNVFDVLDTSENIELISKTNNNSIHKNVKTNDLQENRTALSSSESISTTLKERNDNDTIRNENATAISIGNSTTKNNNTNDDAENDKHDDIEQQIESERSTQVLKPIRQNENNISQNSFHQSIRQGMVSSSNVVLDGVGTILSASKNASQTIVKSSIIAGTTLAKMASTSLIQTANETGIETFRRVQTVGNHVLYSAGSVVPLLRNKTEGKATDAGFVVFTSLYATQTVLQMIHHPKPYVMNVIPAGHDGDIYWRNVGLRHQAKRSGTIMSIMATIILCFFWSIPMTLISSLTEIGTIKESLPKLGEWIEQYPFMEKLLAQLAPMLLLIFNETILPVVLKYFATWEGHISSSLLEASLFVKLGCFMIIQTFFVQVISGGIWSTLSDIIDDPENLLSLLANSIPNRSTYFIQVVLAQTFFLQSMELLRIYPLTVQFLRKYIGPRLTKKERRLPYGILHPLECPPDFWHAETFAQLILFYMISFVYSPIAPITSIVLCFCFLLLESGYRYQFVHNYPKAHDSGGRIWKFFITFTLVSMVIAQLTLIGILSLKQSHYAGPAMGPLFAITILFINDQHAKVSEFLPTRDCILRDSENMDNPNFNMNFVKNAYLQPSLRNSEPIEPDYEDL